MRRTWTWGIQACGRRCRPAFTLIELLAVITILALLLAILFPTVRHAREHGYKAVCQSNLGHLVQALHTYGSAEADMLPPYRRWMTHVMSCEAGGSLTCPKDRFEEEGTEGEPAYTPPDVDDGIGQVNMPPSVVFNDLESNTQINFFIEQESFELPVAVAVDITEPGRYDNNYNRTAGSIPAGTVVHCFFLHYDPVGSQSATSSGQVNFTSDILGIICTSSQLDVTDPILGIPTTSYPTGQRSRGFENNAEQVELGEDRRTFTIHRFHSTFPGEQVRILCATGESGSRGSSGGGGGTGGGISSYGMNNQVRQKMPRMGQLLLVEYNKSIVDVDGMEEGDDEDDDLNEWLAPRHFGQANAAFVDGSVRLMQPRDLDEDNAIWKVAPSEVLRPRRP